MKTQRNGEQGAALIFALGMLALLMIMATAFLSSMLLYRQNSETFSRMTDTETLAQSAIARIIGTMRFIVEETENGESNLFQDIRNFNRVVSVAETGNVNKGTSAAEDLKSEYEYIARLMDKPEWIYVRDARPAIGRAAYVTEDDPIIGRFAYAAVPQFVPKIDLNSAWGVPANGRGGEKFSDIPLSGTLLGDNSTFSYTETNVIDPNIRTLLEGFSFLTRQNDETKWDKVRKYLSVGLPANDAEVNEFYISSEDNSILKEEIFKRIDLATAIANLQDKSSERVGLLIDGDPSGTDALDGFGRVYYYEGGTGDTISTIHNVDVPLKVFFSKFNSDNDKGTFSTSELLKQQIAANMIDFMLPHDSEVTSDKDPGTWSNSNKPKYTGNKKSAYINEVGGVLQFRVDVVKGEKTTTTASIKKVTFVPRCEVVNIYTKGDSDVLRTGGYVAKVNGSVKMKLDIQSSKTSSSITLDEDFKDKDIKISEKAEDSVVKGEKGVTLDNGYFVGEGDEIVFDIEKNEASYDDSSGIKSFTVKVTEIEIKFNTVILSYANSGDGSEAGKRIDFANIDKSIKYEGDGKVTKDGTSEDNIVYINDFKDNIVYINDFKDNIGNSSTDFYFMATLEAIDPRQNLNPGDWISDKKIIANGDEKFPIEDDAVKGNSSLGEQNNFDRTYDAAEMDKEPNDNIAEKGLSTAYIPGEGVRSFWELGAIHRGVKWQTLNLKKSTLNADGTAVDSKYESGDAELLDFVCLLDNAGNSTKFDINARDITIPMSDKDQPGKESWLAFLSGVTYSDNYDDFNTGTSWSGELSTLFGNTTLGYVKSRSEFATYFSEFATYFPEIPGSYNDAKQEAFFGKTANLMEAGYRFPLTTKFVVMAQTIKDIGGVGQDIEFAGYKENGKIEEKSDCRIGKFDYGTFSGELIYFDKITSSQKMLVTISRNPTDGMFVVTDIEYLD